MEPLLISEGFRHRAALTDVALDPRPEKRRIPLLVASGRRHINRPYEAKRYAAENSAYKSPGSGSRSCQVIAIGASLSCRW